MKATADIELVETQGSWGGKNETMQERENETLNCKHYSTKMKSLNSVQRW